MAGRDLVKVESSQLDGMIRLKKGRGIESHLVPGQKKVITEKWSHGICFAGILCADSSRALITSRMVFKGLVR